MLTNIKRKGKLSEYNAVNTGTTNVECILNFTTSNLIDI